jgi:two-component system chemotaxis response regulator CheY
LSKIILTVDDSRTMRDMLALALGDAGFTVVQAVDGEDGLAVLDAHSAKVDVIITDINMPKLDGFGFIEGVRKDQRHRATPILVLTTESDGAKKDRARQAGATGWIVKPFNPDKLVDAIRRVAA